MGLVLIQISMNFGIRFNHHLDWTQISRIRYLVTGCMVVLLVAMDGIKGAYYDF